MTFSFDEIQNRMDIYASIYNNFSIRLSNLAKMYPHLYVTQILTSIFDLIANGLVLTGNGKGGYSADTLILETTPYLAYFVCVTDLGMLSREQAVEKFKVIYHMTDQDLTYVTYFRPWSLSSTVTIDTLWLRMGSTLRLLK